MQGSGQQDHQGEDTAHQQPDASMQHLSGRLLHPSTMLSARHSCIGNPDVVVPHGTPHLPYCSKLKGWEWIGMGCFCPVGFARLCISRRLLGFRQLSLGPALLHKLRTMLDSMQCTSTPGADLGSVQALCCSASYVCLLWQSMKLTNHIMTLTSIVASKPCRAHPPCCGYS